MLSREAQPDGGAALSSRGTAERTWDRWTVFRLYRYRAAQTKAVRFSSLDSHGFLSNKDTEILKLADNFNCDLSGQMGIATPRVREPVGLLTSRNALHEMFWM